MTRELPDHWALRVLVNSWRQPLPSEDAWTRDPALTIRRSKIPGRLLIKSWQYLKAPSIEYLLGDIDLYHSPAGFLAPTREAPRIVSVYDLYFLNRPAREDPYGGGYFARTFPGGLKQCAAVVTASSHTHGQLVERYELDPQRVHVIPLGVDVDFFGSDRDEADGPIIERWSGGEPYLICVSAARARKNLSGLMEIYARARNLDGDLPRLIVVGNMDEGSSGQEIRGALDRLQIAPKVTFTGYLPDAHMAAMYRGAHALINPSLDEGFGLPALEAMACGCPVLATDVGSTREVCGDAALLVERGEVERGESEAMARSLVRISTDEDLRERLISAGAQRVKRFSWASTARRTLALYAEVLNRR